MIKLDLEKCSDKKLCEIVITARYLGLLKEEAISCMEELARRRMAGNSFPYEEFMEEESKKLPDVKVNLKKKLEIGFNIGALKGLKNV